MQRSDSLRPAHVKLFDHLPHQVCVCSYHENVRLILVALKSDSDLSTNFSTFVNQIVCDSQSKECMSKECLVCKDKLNIFSLPGTQQLHFIKLHGSDKLKVSDITDAGQFQIYQIRRSQQEQEQPPSHVNDTTPEQEDSIFDPSPPEQLNVGEWVVVCYEGDKFPGEITSTSSDNQDVEVRVMHKSGSGWKWPTREDNIFYKVEDIECKIKPPTSAGSRGQFVFEDCF